jgi:putative hydrolase of the HAD superfamily
MSASDQGQAVEVAEAPDPPPCTKRTFARTSAWIFDLDNTLYPARCNLFAEVDMRMGAFIAQYLGVPLPYARHLQKSYYRQFGTTLSGLMQVHKLNPQPFLDYVHDIDLSPVPEAPELAAAIAALPGRKLIFTNGSRRHAERVAEKLGVLHLFEDICDIAACGFVAKPEPDAFNRMVNRHGVEPQLAAMFEDLPHNLEAPHALGTTTVLVHSEYPDHPVQLQMRTWTELPAHIHYTTDDLTGFLAAIFQNRAGATLAANG